MRAAGIIALAGLIYTVNAFADLTIRYESIEHDQRRFYHSVMLKDDLLRVTPATREPTAVLVDIRSGDIVQLHEPSQRFFKINANTIDQYVGFYQENRSMLQGLIDQGLAHLDPAHRSRAEHLLKQFDREPNNPLQARKTNVVDTVLGVQCQVIALIENQRLNSELCMASYAELGLDQQEIENLERLKVFAHRFKNSAPQQHRRLFDLLDQGPQGSKGVPMKIVQYKPDGRVARIIEAASISLRAIPDQAYRIPQHYQPQSTPIL